MGLILVVSEDLGEIETIKAALSVHGWWVTVAADRQTALRVAADQAPKLVVVDSDLPDSLDLVRSFGSCNGGPGVLSCVPQGFDRSLDFKQAGGDEILTKPVAPASVLEAVQRYLAGPRVEAAAPAEPSSLLTTEEIFGDVLREIESGDEAVGAAPTAESIPESSPAPVPEPAPATVAEEVVFEPEPAPAPEPPPEPVVSLAGLFDESDEPEAIATPPAAESRSRAEEWSGEERRRADRPWSGQSSEPQEAQPAVPEPEGDVLFTPALPSVEGEALRADLDWIDELEEHAVDSAAAGDAEAPPGEAGRPFPRVAVAIGALAAVLLLAVGILLFVNGGAEPEGGEPDGRPPLESEAPLSSELQGASPAAELAARESDARFAAEPEVPAEIEPPGGADELEDLDLQAIVDQELERREEELRRIFLEEEKRLLRELNNLDPDEEPAPGDGEGDSKDRSGVGR